MIFSIPDFARAGYQVSLYCRTQQTLDKAVESIGLNLCVLMEGQAGVEDDIRKIISRTPITRNMGEALANASVAIESVAQDLRVK